VIYLWYYHAGGNGPSSYDEYVAEVQTGEEAKAAYLAKSANNVDENTVKVLDATAIASGKTIFETNCAACHAKDGGGGVGPNLTDEYWLHGGGVKNVFKSIKYGWPDKGMKSWKDDFSPNQIAQLASYITTLQGTKPLTPKEKQGELYNEGNSNAADSSASVDKTVQKL
jgi:cytochrome c oxidase cbb3-type subunit 3